MVHGLQQTSCHVKCWTIFSCSNCTNALPLVWSSILEHFTSGESGGPLCQPNGFGFHNLYGYETMSDATSISAYRRPNCFKTETLSKSQFLATSLILLGQIWATSTHFEWWTQLNLSKNGAFLTAHFGSLAYLEGSHCRLDTNGPHGCHWVLRLDLQYHNYVYMSVCLSYLYVHIYRIQYLYCHIYIYIYT